LSGCRLFLVANRTGWWGSGAVGHLLDASLLGTVGAAEHAAVGLHAMADDPAAAVLAGWRQRMDGAFEAVKVWVAPATVT
jgi:hypothetical protein